jgi:NitT/TauT family transport system permease protein
MRAWLKPLVVVAGLIVIWQMVVTGLGIPKWLLPSPIQIALRFVEDYAIIAISTAKTLQVVLIGFSISVTVGLLFGVIFVESKTLREALYPLLTVSQVTPQIAIAPLLVIWFGSGDLPKVVIATIVPRLLEAISVWALQ